MRDPGRGRPVLIVACTAELTAGAGSAAASGGSTGAQGQTRYAKVRRLCALPGVGASPVGVSAQIGSLAGKTAYSFPISATSGGGTSVGKVKKLKTH